MDWKWKVGIISGYGEAFWQQMLGKVRRITKPVMTDKGLGFMKPIFVLVSDDQEPQFDVSDVVVLGVDVKEDLVFDLDRAWSNSGIIPANGTPRF